MAAAAGGRAGEHLVQGVDQRVRVRNTTAAPYRYICNIVQDGWAMCSGTLIGPHTVLTAGHCIEGARAGRMAVVPGRAGRSEPLGRARVAGFRPYPGYAGATATDLGLIYLREPIGTRIGPDQVRWLFRYRR
jgi:glutamyl endopeptidase